MPSVGDSDWRDIAASDSRGGVYNRDGLTHADVAKTKETVGTVAAHSGTQISNDDLLELDVDILIPSALENAMRRLMGRGRLITLIHEVS